MIDAATIISLRALRTRPAMSAGSTIVEGLAVDPLGLPLPPGYTPMDPRQVIPDIADLAPWSAYAGQSPRSADLLLVVTTVSHRSMLSSLKR